EVYLHNAFGQLTNRITQHWTGEFGWSQSFQNNRGADSEYDADGRPLRVGSSTSGDELHYVYDAAGQITKTTATANNYTDHTIDGNGLVVEQVKYYWLPSPESFNTVANIDTLFIRSSVLGGQTVTEAWGSDFGADVDAGEKCRTFVRAGGTDLAIQYEGQGTAPDQVLWDHRDPSNSTMRMTDSTGAIPGGIGGPNSMEMDPMGASVQFEDPYVLPDPAQPNPGSSNLFPYLTSPSYTRPEIVWMGIPISYEFYLDLFHNGMIHGPFGMLRSAYGYIGTTSEPGVRSPEAPNTPVPDVVTDWYFSLPWWTTLIPAAQPNPGGQLPTTRFPVSSVLSGCKFKVSISNNNNLKKAELDALQKEIARIYAKAGQEIEFTTTGFADYFLGLNATASGYVTKSDKTVGQTGFNGPNVFNRGQVFIDRLVLSAKDDNVVSGSKDYFNQNSKSRAIGLARAGSHEIGHFLLQQNYDSGDIEGVMHDGFIGKQWTGADKANQGIWEFTPAQIKQLNSLCGR
ncbi:MAG: RHS repeat domain-containing protein, partial [Pyrinomonadaceae bacterium]